MRLVSAKLAVLIATIMPVVAFAAGPELRFEQEAITIAQVTPGEEVVLCGFAREPRPGTPGHLVRVPRAVILTDSDGDGVVRYEVGGAVPHQAMWVAVDLTTGGHAGSTSPDYHRPPLPLTPELAKNDNAGQLRKVQWPMAEMHACLVRPGTGAWKLYASGETEADESGPDEPLRIDISRFQPLGTTGPAPQNFRPGDVLVVFDSTRMRFGIIEVGR